MSGFSGLKQDLVFGFNLLMFWHISAQLYVRLILVGGAPSLNNTCVKICYRIKSLKPIDFQSRQCRHLSQIVCKTWAKIFMLSNEAYAGIATQKAKLLPKFLCLWKITCSFAGCCATLWRGGQGCKEQVQLCNEGQPKVEGRVPGGSHQQHRSYGQEG